jgi:hypothetical protein
VPPTPGSIAILLRLGDVRKDFVISTFLVQLVLGCFSG